MNENQINLNAEALEWLLNNGGPVIRYRAAREFLNKPGSGIEQYKEDFLQSQIVKIWIDRLDVSTEANQLHSSKVTAYENAMGKLIQLGCHNGITSFDEKTKKYCELLSQEIGWSPFSQMIVASFLIAAGYYQDIAIQAYLKHRLNILWRFTRDKNFDIYADREQYPDIPKGFHDKPLVKPEFYIDGEEQFPTIYDMHALANYPAHLLSEDILEKIDSVIEYVLHPEYQAFPEGYGLMKAGKRKYHAIGWSVHLPKYANSEEKSYDDNRLIQRLVLMSNFRVARKHPWFLENVKRLEEYRTENGTFIFPRAYLPERASGYWVTSAYMGIGENRRKRIAIEIEATFWMLKIRKNCQDAN